MASSAQAGGYLVLVVDRDGTCLYSPNLPAMVAHRPWDLCWEEEGRARLREAFVQACMFREPQREVHAALRIDDRAYDFEAWLDPAGDDLVICRMVRVFTSLLSDRERHVLSLVAGGASNAEISQLLGTQQSTVRSHLRKMREKLGVVRPEGLLLAAVGLQQGRGALATGDAADSPPANPR